MSNISELLASKDSLTQEMTINDKIELISEMRVLSDGFLVESLRTMLMEVARRNVTQERGAEAFVESDPTEEIGNILDFLKESL